MQRTKGGRDFVNDELPGEHGSFVPVGAGAGSAHGSLGVQPGVRSCQACTDEVI